MRRCAEPCYTGTRHKSGSITADGRRGSDRAAPGLVVRPPRPCGPYQSSPESSGDVVGMCQRRLYSISSTSTDERLTALLYWIAVLASSK